MCYARHHSTLHDACKFTEGAIVFCEPSFESRIGGASHDGARPRCRQVQRPQCDVCTVILQSGLRRGGWQQPVVQKTTLGWILSGSVGTSVATQSAQTYHCWSDDDLHDLVQKFWRQEEVVAKTVPLTDEQEAEDHFVRTHSRDASSRFVRLPLRLPLPDLTGMKRTAARLLGYMEPICPRRLDEAAVYGLHAGV
ncbi:hypothetical protein ACFW04_012559 [Cataglyphis niger]